MARGGGNGDGGAGSPPGGRPGRASGGTGSVAAAQETVAAEVRLGRPGGGRSPEAENGSGQPAGGQTDDLVTYPTGPPGGRPEGEPTRIRPNEDDDVRRSLERENSGAAILADNGHRIRQNPSAAEVAQARQDRRLGPAHVETGLPAGGPRLRLLCTVGAQGRAGHLERGRDEGRRPPDAAVVVNLEDWRGSVPDLERQFRDWPIENLKEVKVITPDGEIVQIAPNPESG